MLKSRSSDSFTSQLKDFIAPVGISLTNCGALEVTKVDDAGTPLEGAEFALDVDGIPNTTDDQTPIPPVEGQTGLFCVDDLLFDDYHVVETLSPDGFTPEDPVQDFTVDSPSTCEERTADPVDEPDLRFVNLRNPGAILITKTAKDFSAESGSSPLAGVDFTVTDSQGAEVAGSPVTTDANGQACIGGLTVVETYTVTESGVPAGFQLPDPRPAEDVTISDDATCDTPASVPDTASFTNDPLSEIEVNFTSLAGNRTAATIDCTGANRALTATPEDDTPDDFDDTSETFTNLKEGTYNCTVVIDP